MGILNPSRAGSESVEMLPGWSLKSARLPASLATIVHRRVQSALSPSTDAEAERERKRLLGNERMRLWRLQNREKVAGYHRKRCEKLKEKRRIAKLERGANTFRKHELRVVHERLKLKAAEIKRPEDQDVDLAHLETDLPPWPEPIIETAKADFLTAHLARLERRESGWSLIVPIGELVADQHDGRFLISEFSFPIAAQDKETALSLAGIILEGHKVPDVQGGKPWHFISPAGPAGYGHNGDTAAPRVAA